MKGCRLVEEGTRMGMATKLGAVVAFLFLLACSGLFGTPQEQMQWSYEWRLEDIDEIVAAASDPAQRAEVEAAKAAFEAEYAVLPAAGPERDAALGDLNTRMKEAIDGWQPILDAHAAADEAAKAGKVAEATAEMDAYKSTFVGLWQGGGVTLGISPEYHVDYEKKTGVTSSSLQAPITSFRKDAFEAGVFGITSTFHIDEAPHEVDGKWVMKLDGVELRRVE